MDLMALVAVAIALVGSFGEMISKYERFSLKEILNWYLGLYLLINGFFAFITYYFLPDVAAFFLQPDQVAWMQQPTWGRVFVAAFGYMAIARTKVLTIKETPIGIDTLYDAFASFCLRHTNTAIENAREAILEAVYKDYSSLQVYEDAFDARLKSAVESERETLRSQRKVIRSSTLKEKVKCKSIGNLLLQIVGSEKELRNALESAK